MKEHVQDYGVRKWAGDDLIELQSEPLSALQALVAPYAPCILQGCELETIPDGDGDYRLHAGYVALKGRKTVENGAGGTGDGAETAAETAENEATTAAEEYVKIVRVTAQTVHQPTIFLTLGCTPVSRAYGNGENKAIAYDYTAEVCDVLSKVGDRPYLELVADADNPRLPDKLGITQKLDRDGGEATDTVVKFTETFTETDSVPDRPELKSGSRLGLLMRQIRKWFDELKGLKDLAFKDKVALTDLDADVKKELDGKVAQEDGWGLSKNDFSNKWMEKLDGIDDNANNYVHPTYNALGGNVGPMTPDFGGKAYTYTYNTDSEGHVTGVNSRTITIPSTLATTSAVGLMSASDKIKLNGIATGATKVVVDSALSSSSTNPVQNKAVYSALSGKSDSGHVHSWDSVTGKPSSFTPTSHSHSEYSITGHTHTPNSIGAPKVIAMAKISSSGTVTNLYGTVTCARAGTGIYIIRNVTQSNVIIISGHVAGLMAKEVLEWDSFQVIFYNSSNTKTDSGFTVMILGL